MTEEYEELATEPDDFDGETYVDSIGMLEYLIAPGKTYGQCHFHPRNRILMCCTQRFQFIQGKKFELAEMATSGTFFA
jgi:hypothetical protein